MSIYIPKKETVFIHIPKNAGSAISSWLEQNCGGKQVGKRTFGGKHADVKRARALLGHDFKKVIISIRNPWDRVVSAYHYYLNRNKTTIATGKTFEEFVLSRDWGCANKQCVKYYNTADIIIRYEHINDDFKQVQDFLKCDIPLYRKNISPHSHYTDYYTSQEMIDTVADKHSEDIKRFSYNFG